ncbi:hypothetical protein PV327_011574, partial [Microctonus hyperodae]
MPKNSKSNVGESDANKVVLPEGEIANEDIVTEAIDMSTTELSRARGLDESTLEVEVELRRKKPDSAIAKHLREIAEKVEKIKSTALPTDGADKPCESRGAIPKRGRPTIVTDEYYAPEDGASSINRTFTQQDGHLETNKTRRVMFKEPGHVTSSPIPPSRIISINEDRNTVEMSRESRNIATPELSRVPPPHPVYSSERSVITWGNNVNQHDTYTINQGSNTTTNERRYRPRGPDDTQSYQSKYSTASESLRRPRYSNPFEGDNDEIVSEKVNRAGTQLTRRGIEFSGKPGEDGEDGEEFLRLLSDVILQYNIRRNEALSLIPFTLEMPALSWYRTEVRNFRNYDDFYDSFIERFTPFDSQDRVWEDIRTRSQGQMETLSEYLMHMQ